MGLVLLGKFNAYVVLPISAMVVLLTVQRFRRGVSATLLVSVVALGVAGWWFGHNIRHYGEPLGMSAVSHALQSVSPEFRSLAAGGRDLGYLLTQTDWPWTNIFSLLAAFGYMELWLPMGYYVLWTLLLLVWSYAIMRYGFGWLIRMVHLVRNCGLGPGLRLSWRTRYHGLLYASFLTVITISVAQSAWTSLVNEFQPQGRYLLPAIVPFFVLAYVAIDSGIWGSAVFRRVLLWSGPIFLALTNLFAYHGVLAPAYRG
jgi:hypothetical protein